MKIYSESDIYQMNDNKTCTNTRESTLQVSIYRMKNNRTNVSEHSIAKEHFI